MKYRRLGRTGLIVSEIGMGLEHLLDKEERVVVETIQAAVNGGVNYFDCLPLTEYSAETGTNEGYVKLGKALDGLRDNVYLSFLAYVSRPIDYIRADFECYLRELKTGHTDVFIIACCDKETDFEAAMNGELFGYAKKLQAEGKVKFIGFSTHNAALAHKVITCGEFDVLMFPINPAFDVIDDEEKYNSDILGNIWGEAYRYTADSKTEMPRKSVYDACDRHGVGLVAMKPFAGGFILGVEGAAGFTPVNLVAYALAQTGVSAVVPGCSSPEQIEEILTYYTCENEKRDYAPAISRSRWSIKDSCLYCGHCLPCAAGIDIAGVNRLLREYENREIAQADAGDIAIKYAALKVKASACTKCGECEARCPFEVKVTENMTRAAQILGN